MYMLDRAKRTALDMCFETVVIWLKFVQYGYLAISVYSHLMKIKFQSMQTLIMQNCIVIFFIEQNGWPLTFNVVHLLKFGQYR